MLLLLELCRANVSACPPSCDRTGSGVGVLVCDVALSSLPLYMFAGTVGAGCLGWLASRPMGFMSRTQKSSKWVRVFAPMKTIGF